MYHRHSTSPRRHLCSKLEVGDTVGFYMDLHLCRRWMVVYINDVCMGLMFTGLTLLEDFRPAVSLYSQHDRIEWLPHAVIPIPFPRSLLPTPCWDLSRSNHVYTTDGSAGISWLPLMLSDSPAGLAHLKMGLVTTAALAADFAYKSLTDLVKCVMAPGGLAVDSKYGGCLQGLWSTTDYKDTTGKSIWITSGSTLIWTYQLNSNLVKSSIHVVVGTTPTVQNFHLPDWKVPDTMKERDLIPALSFYSTGTSLTFLHEPYLASSTEEIAALSDDAETRGGCTIG